MPFNTRSPIPFVLDLFLPPYVEGAQAGSVSSNSYSNIRGLMISKKEKDVSKALTFQFNPNNVSVQKGNVWEVRKYTGRSETETLWISGDVKTIRFKLWFDATNTQQYHNIVEYKDRTTSVEPDSDRGTLFFTDTLESFQYPELDTRPEFVRGNVSISKQFYPPPTIIFVYGQFYFETKLVDLSMQHTAFNKKLIPIRSECDVTLNVLEGYKIDVDVKVDRAANGTSNDFPNGSFIDSPIGNQPSTSFT